MSSPGSKSQGAVAGESLTAMLDAPSPKVLLIVGGKETEFWVCKSRLCEIPVFAKMLSSDFGSQEALESKVTLVEDSSFLWGLALAFLDTGHLFPSISVAKPPKDEAGISMQASQMWPYHVLSVRKAKEFLNCALQVIDWKGNKTAFDPRSDQVGHWRTTDETHALFEQLVDLYCLADKYMWPKLMQACMRRIHCFPIGPRALSVLMRKCLPFMDCATTEEVIELDAGGTMGNSSPIHHSVEELEQDRQLDDGKTWELMDIDDISRAPLLDVNDLSELSGWYFPKPVPSTNSVPTEECQWTNDDTIMSTVSTTPSYEDTKGEMIELLNEALAFHGTSYEEITILAKNETTNANLLVRQRSYEDAEKFMKEGMGIEQWHVLQTYVEARAARARNLEDVVRSNDWYCQQTREGIIEDRWTIEAASDACFEYLQNKRMKEQEDAQGSFELTSGPDFTDIFPGFDFTEANIGDLILTAGLDIPAKGFCYGKVHRTQKWGFFDMRRVRLLEKKSLDQCFCECCRPPSQQDGPW